MGRLNERICVIIPTYKDIELVKKCLDAILGNTNPSDYGHLSFWVVEDSELKGYLKSDYSCVGFISMGSNKGFASTVNHAWSIASNTNDFTHLVLMNNDVLVKDGWLEGLLQPMRKDKSIAITGGKLTYLNGSIQHAGVFMVRTGNTFLFDHRYRGQESFNRLVNYQSEVIAVTGALMCIKVSFLEYKGSLFPSTSKMAYEDVLLCEEARNLGYKVVYSPKAEAMHLEGFTRGASPDEKCLTEDRKKWQTWEDEGLVAIRNAYDWRDFILCE